MVIEKLIVEMGRFTGQTGLQVHKRLKSEVSNKWNRLQQPQLRKSSNLSSPEAVKEIIVVKALDRFLTELSAKDALENKVGQAISNEQWNELVCIDRAFSLEELRAICLMRGLKHTGNKKELAWELLKSRP